MSLSHQSIPYGHCRWCGIADSGSPGVLYPGPADEAESHSVTDGIIKRNEVNKYEHHGSQKRRIYLR